jgi:hypothetical protein
MSRKFHLDETFHIDMPKYLQRVPCGAFIAALQI